MRISDWSSDVCSSDLAGSPSTLLAEGADLRTDIPLYRIWRDGKLAEEVSDATQAWAEHDDMVAFLIGCSFTFETALQEAGIEVRHITEIGRASCRERVCQYVSMSVAAVSLKKKKKK